MRRFFVLLMLFFSAVAPLPAFAQNSPSVNAELVYRTTFGRADDIKILLQRGADPNTKNAQGISVLLIATDRTDAESFKIVQALVEGGADVNAPDSLKNYPIMNAVRNGRADILRFLMSKKADPNVRDARGKPLYQVALATNNREIMRILEAAMANEKRRFEEMRSPENLKRLANDYAKRSCYYQYWVYYLASKQDPEKTSLTRWNIEVQKREIANTSNTMLQLFPRLGKEFYRRLSEPATKAIFDELDKMVSNHNRQSKGVGTDEDVSTRCEKIVENIKIKLPAEYTPVQKEEKK